MSQAPPPPGRPTPPLEAKPGLYQALCVLTLVDGCLNLVVALVGGVFLLCSTIFCFPLAAYPLVLGILELVQYPKLNAGPPRCQRIPVWLGVLQLINVIFSNPLSLATGVIMLIANANDDVQAYLRGNAAVQLQTLTCHRCGFDLRGSLAEGRTVCPECGAPLAIVEAARAALNEPPRPA